MADYDWRKIGTRIRYEREKKGWKTTDFAAILGVTDQAIRNWENGTNQIPFTRLFDMCSEEYKIELEKPVYYASESTFYKYHSRKKHFEEIGLPLVDGKYVAPMFNCELGYLLCEQDCKTRVATDICSLTGLSEEAVSFLINRQNLKCTTTSNPLQENCEVFFELINCFILNCKKSIGTLQGYAISLAAEELLDTYSKEQLKDLDIYHQLSLQGNNSDFVLFSLVQDYIEILKKAAVPFTKKQRQRYDLYIKELPSMNAEIEVIKENIVKAKNEMKQALDSKYDNDEKESISLEKRGELICQLLMEIDTKR